MMEAAGFAETPIYIYQSTRCHIQNSLSSGQHISPDSASVSNGRILLQPSGGILLQLAIIPFSEYGNSWSLLDEGNKKARERLLFIKRKLLFVSADLTVSRC